MYIEQRVFCGSTIYDTVKAVQEFLGEAMNKYEIISIQYLNSNHIVHGIVVYKWKGCKNV